MTTLLDAPATSEVSLEVPSMGGRLRLVVACDPVERERARRDLAMVARRVDRWAARLTRFDDTSELSRVNGQPAAPATRVGPTLAAVLAWGREAGRSTDGVVDVTLLDARLAAEDGDRDTGPAAGAGWELVSKPDARHTRLLRQSPVRFDLDGVAKGWIADRALSLLGRYPAALVDADGDIAVRVDERTGWEIGVADPRDPDADLVRLRLDAVGPLRLGIATSGTTVHRWADDPGRHHLIDPATRRPAATDLEQCTVVAVSAALAEAVAKAVVIRGSEQGESLIGRSGALGAVLVRHSGEVLVTSEAVTWLA